MNSKFINTNKKLLSLSRSQLSNLQPVQVTELEAEFAKIEGQKANPTRYLKSQQEKQAKLAVEAAEDEGNTQNLKKSFLRLPFLCFKKYFKITQLILKL